MNRPTLNPTENDHAFGYLTSVIAAIGVAVISGSPAFAAKRSDARAQAYTTVSSDWQAALEYAKDAPIHTATTTKPFDIAVIR